VEEAITAAPALLDTLSPGGEQEALFQKRRSPRQLLAGGFVYPTQ
jgi:hypothetical protein